MAAPQNGWGMVGIAPTSSASSRRRPPTAVLASADLPCDYTFPAPCHLTASAPLQIDTTKLPDGTGPVTLVARDAAQNLTTTTIHPMVANRPPPTPTLSGIPTGSTSQTSFAVTAQVPSTGVPISTLDWMLCAATRGPTTAVPVNGQTVGFTVTAPADGTYTIKAYSVDAAGHTSPVAAQSFVVARAPVPPLASGPNASLALPPAVGHGGVQLYLLLRRPAHARLELIVRTSPKTAGSIHVGLTFTGRPRTIHPLRLRLRHGSAVLLVHIPRRAAGLTVEVAGLGAHATRHVRLARSA